MGQRFWACHNHWVGHSHFGTEATKLLRPWLFWANFEVHSGLLTDTKTWWWPCEYTTLFGPHLVQECHFRAPWSRTNSKKWRGAKRRLNHHTGSGVSSGCYTWSHLCTILLSILPAEMKPQFFWQWTNFTDYLVFLLFLCLAIGTITILLTL